MRFIVNRGSGRIRYVSGGLFESNGTWIHPRRTLEDYELIVCRQGSFRLHANDRTFELKEGDGLFLLPGEVHFGVEEAENVSFYWMHFLFEEKAGVFSRGGVIVPILSDVLEGKSYDGYLLAESFRCEAMERLMILFKQLLDYEKRAVHTRRMCDLQMELILVEITGICLRQRIQHLNQSNPNHVMEKICDYIRANLYTNIQVQQLARRFGYNPEYFVRLFHQQMGVTPKQYLLNTQMERAKFLLTTTDLKIKEVAEMVGFSDEKRFMKNFKQQEGMSASSYRSMFEKTHYNSK